MHSCHRFVAKCKPPRRCTNHRKLQIQLDSHIGCSTLTSLIRITLMRMQSHGNNGPLPLIMHHIRLTRFFFVVFIFTPFWVCFHFLIVSHAKIVHFDATVCSIWYRNFVKCHSNQCNPFRNALLIVIVIKHRHNWKMLWWQWKPSGWHLVWLPGNYWAIWNEPHTCGDRDRFLGSRKRCIISNIRDSTSWCQVDNVNLDLLGHFLWWPSIGGPLESQSIHRKQFTTFPLRLLLLSFCLFCIVVPLKRLIGVNLFVICWKYK